MRPVRRVLVVGSINHDDVNEVEELPVPGATVLSHQNWSQLGGKGANQAVAAARLGADVVMVGAVGSDPEGREALSRLRREGVNVANIAQCHAETGRASVIVDRSGENFIVVRPGANRADDGLAERASQVMDEGDIVLAQGEISADVITEVSRRAVEVAHRFILNLAPVGLLSPAVIAEADPLVLNESEAADLARMLGHGGASFEELVKRIARRCRSLVITRGAAGALVVEAGHTTSIPAHPTIVVDTTGAGDAFVGALAAALADGLTLVEASHRASAAAALAVAARGAMDSYPRSKDHAAQLRPSAPYVTRTAVVNDSAMRSH
jgi:ribokinase